MTRARRPRHTYSLEAPQLTLDGVPGPVAQGDLFGGLDLSAPLPAPEHVTTCPACGGPAVGGSCSSMLCPGAGAALQLVDDQDQDGDPDDLERIADQMRRQADREREQRKPRPCPATRRPGEICAEPHRYGHQHHHDWRHDPACPGPVMAPVFGVGRTECHSCGWVKP